LAPAEAVVVHIAERGEHGRDDENDDPEDEEFGHGSNPALIGMLPRVAEMTTSIDFLPDLCHGGLMIENVAVVAYDGVSPFELGVLCEAWGTDRSDQGLPVFDFALCAPRPGRIATAAGFGLAVDLDLGRVAEADLVAVPAVPRREPVPDAVVRVLQQAYERGARVMSICSGAFALGEAGLLDGRSCTTHWFYTDELAERFPKANVIPEVLYVDEDPIITGAGSAAGLDACLHLYRKEFGATVASMVARRMVVPPQRDGGQAQFIRSAVPDCDAETLGPLLVWLTENLRDQHTVESLAEAASMSPRTFARRFRAETGTTPHAWITSQRVLRTEELLESTDRSVDQIAYDVGFANAATLRHHFSRVRGLSPQRYRQTFGCSVESEQAG
jgi:transcriptional regulator GlxA family with amidase domain